MKFPVLIFLVISTLFYSCQKVKIEKYPISNLDTTKIFTAVPSSYSGIEFNNKLNVSELMSPLQNVNVYNGGGVAVGDINNDGLVDIFFTGNQVDNRLYLNKDGLSFEDITAKAGVASPNSWCTGATIVDINNDGLNDIYVCRSYYGEPSKRTNQLFINNGDLTFTERAEEYGLNDEGYSIMASFFDYDKDGLLDVFIGNHPPDRFLSYEEHFQNWSNPRLETSNQLYRNTGKSFFQKTTSKAGLVSYGWTLGMVTVDLNQDNWPDIYVTVDHTEPDRFYINNKNGTFREASVFGFEHMSQSSMGVDAGDINNDGLTDLITVEMLAEDPYRAKTQMQNMEVDRFWDFVRKGHNYQYMRNMLHVNNGNETFRELGQMAKIHKTDWSWASLFMDMDNDGWQDLYISNGYYRDYSDQDYRISYNEKMQEADLENNQGELRRLLVSHSKDAGSTKLKNYAFKNNGNYGFENISELSGLDFEGFSNGAAYADFDKDGDLDLVVNNIDDKASLYINGTIEKGGNNWLRVGLQSAPNNTKLNTKVTVKTKSGIQFKEHTLTRGYQSSSEDALHFGIGKESDIEEIKVVWPDGASETVSNVAANSEITFLYENAKKQPLEEVKESPLFRDVEGRLGINFEHQEKYNDDYAVQVLLPHQMSCFGPALAKGDVNGDGLEDVFLGGAQEQVGALFIQEASGGFYRTGASFLAEDGFREDLGAAFFDIDNDGDLDLYVTSGGNEKPHKDVYYTDRLYLNNGDGTFQKSVNSIPKITESGSCVKPFDFDGDGDMDLFLGSRHTPGKYPFAPKSYLLENRNGKLVDVTSAKAPDLSSLGMVTDAVWTDFDKDGRQDLIIVGEWMPVSILINKNGNFLNETETYGLLATRGWWNTIDVADFNEDGNLEYVLGNLGTNYKYQVSEKSGFHIYGGDFDNNGSSDIVLSYDKGDKLLPVRGKQCSSEQIPGLKKIFPTFDSFASATLPEIYGDKLESALHYSIDTFHSSILKQNKAGNWILENLPDAVQSAPINDVIIKDFDGDGFKDILAAGNLLVSEVETGRADAGIGCFLKGREDGSFQAQFYNTTGFFARDDVKKLETLKTNNGNYFLVVRNNGPVQIIR
ncbi:MAG: hypothetical protein CL596_02930 [Alteromonas sp.]|nr:hypothetical protein [Alteromonas sp.]MAY21388.1 hypothetical protein [Flavobacteriaceae bacterium]|tara:strand:+ start:22605 stop:25922 length:3318 start_codon:yes stop_codon:yes gene_type:complete